MVIRKKVKRFLKRRNKMKNLKNWFFECWEARDQHNKKYHFDGCCWAGKHSARLHRLFSTHWASESIFKGINLVDNNFIEMSQDVLVELLQIIALPKESRENFFWQMQKEFDEKK